MGHFTGTMTISLHLSQREVAKTIVQHLPKHFLPLILAPIPLIAVDWPRADKLSRYGNERDPLPKDTMTPWNVWIPGMRPTSPFHLDYESIDFESDCAGGIFPVRADQKTKTAYPFDFASG